MTSQSHNSSQADNLAALARSVCEQFYENIVSQEERVTAGDAEAVHDMRVATRRLRVALSNFAACFEAEKRGDLRTRLGQMADLLGAVRDLDVMLEALKQHKLSPEQHRYVSGLSRRLRAQRQRRRRKLLAYLQGDEYATFKRQFPLLTAQGQVAD